MVNGRSSAVSSDAAPIKLPVSARKGTWNWLRPFLLQEESDGARHYNALDVEEGKIYLACLIPVFGCWA